jgi:hypothetical protein
MDRHNSQKVGGFGMISWGERPVAMTEWVKGDLKRGHISPILLQVLLDFANMGLIIVDPVDRELERWRKAHHQCIHRLPLHTERDTALAIRMYNRRRALADADPFMQIMRAINLPGPI